MERKLMQKTIAAIMAVALLGGAITAPAGDKPLFSSIMSANAEDTSTVSFNDATLTLTLSGEVVKSEVQQWANNSDVKKVVCEENTVLPADCTGLFSGFMAEEIDLSNADSSAVTGMIIMFAGCSRLRTVNLGSLNAKKVTNMSGMFYNCSSLEKVDLGSFDTSKVSEMTGMFYNCSSLEELDIDNFDTSKVHYMTDMFNGCSGLTKLDPTNFKTSNVDYMNYMFNDCTSLKDLDITSFEVPDNTYSQDNILTNCPAYNVTMEGAQLLLDKGLIGMQVVFTTNTDLKTVVIDGPDGEKRLDVSDLEKNADGKYVAYYFIDPTQSRSTITYSFYNKDGKKINLLNSNRQIVNRSSYSCTVNELIENYISLYGSYDITNKEKTLAEKLLNFCNAAENYFCQGQYAITGLTMEDIANIKNNHSTDLPDNIKKSLVLNSATSFRIYTDSKSVIFDDSTVKATPRKKDGKQYY